MPKPNNVEPIGGKANSGRIVQLEADSERMMRAKLARLPEAVQAVRETCHRVLLSRLKSYFERADDSLFELADKASSNEEQNLYFDSMREVRVRRHSIETNFTQAIDEAFGALVQAASTSGEDVYDTLKADALSLVHDDDLEALVAVDSSVARANAEFGESIQYLSLRLDSLMPVKVYQKNNPVGPDVICAAFMAEIKKLDVNIKAKLVLFRLFDKFVIANLGQVYKQVNNVLIEHNVMPSLPSRAGNRGSSQRTSNRRPTNQRYTDPNQIVGAVLQSEGAAGVMAPEVAATLTQLFGDQIIANNSVQVSAEQLAANQLVQLLNAAQRLPQKTGLVIRGKDIRAVVAKLRERKGGGKIGSVEDQVMNLVNMLFDFILEDRNLPATMKMLISRMQIPIIKVALADKTFFTKKGHVARKLLNEMSTAAIGWQGDADNADRDPLYKKIDQIVRTLITDFDTDVSIFNDLLVDFNAFLEKERKRVAILERRTVDAEDGKAKAEVARTTVALELEVRVCELELTEELNKLVNEAWSNVMFVTALKYGYKSPEWESMLTTLDELIWSVQQPASTEQRHELIKNVPGLLKKLRSGLDTISYNPFEMSTLFKALEGVHLSCIRGKSPIARKQEKAANSEQASVDSNDQNLTDALSDSPKNLNENEQVSTHSDSGEALKAHSVEQVADSVAPSSEESLAKNSAAQGDLEAEHTKVEEIDVPGLDPFSSSAMKDSLVQDSESKEPLSADEDEYLKQVEETFSQGAWFDMQLDEEGSSRCRLAAFIKPTGKYIFVNRNGMKVAEKTKEDLADMLRHNAIRALDNSMLFDRALETIVSGIRDSRPAQH